eukprot:SAG11_NODE_686_length_7720_cov_1.748327_6_plen_189_part_00
MQSFAVSRQKGGFYNDGVTMMHDKGPFQNDFFPSSSRSCPPFAKNGVEAEGTITAQAAAAGSHPKNSEEHAGAITVNKMHALIEIGMSKEEAESELRFASNNLSLAANKFLSMEPSPRVGSDLGQSFSGLTSQVTPRLDHRNRDCSINTCWLTPPETLNFREEEELDAVEKRPHAAHCTESVRKTAVP